MHFCVIRSKTICFALLMLLVAILLSVSVGGHTSAQVFFGHSTRLVPVYEVETEEKKIAISFDAAWGADKTEGILNTLQDFNATATFFLVGFWIDKYPEMVQKIDDAGMEIGNHSLTHPDMTTISQEKMREEISAVNSQITAITNKPVKVFRCPYGAYNNSVINAIQAENLLPVQWSVDSLDWKGLSAGEIANRVLASAKSGSIILCHNNADNILDALVLILNRLTTQGYKIVSVGELVYFDNYLINHNGVQSKQA